MSQSATHIPNVTAVALPSARDFKRGEHTGDRCCLQGWIGRVLNIYAFSDEAQEHGVAICKLAKAKAYGCPVTSGCDVTEAFDEDKTVSFEAWAKAFRQHFRNLGYTRRCKVPRPAPL